MSVRFFYFRSFSFQLKFLESQFFPTFFFQDIPNLDKRATTFVTVSILKKSTKVSKLEKRGILDSSITDQPYEGSLLSRRHGMECNPTAPAITRSLDGTRQGTLTLVLNLLVYWFSQDLLVRNQLHLCL